MGVRGLTTYIHAQKLGVPWQIHGTDIVVDGSSIMYALYSNVCRKYQDHLFAGNYVAFGQEIQEFIYRLAECQIKPIFVMDGGIDPSAWKIDTVLQRMDDRLSNMSKVVSRRSKKKDERLIPILHYQVFIDVLAKLNVSVIRTVFEADAEVVAVANALKLPVLSSDSDFYIFHIEAGYIPATQTDLFTLHTKRDPVNPHKRYKFLQGKLFMRKMFKDQFPSLDVSLMPCLAIALGNDYIEEGVFREFLKSIAGDSGDSRQSKQANVSAFLNWMQGKNLFTIRQIMLSQIMNQEKRERISDLFDRVLVHYAKGQSDVPCLVAHATKTHCPLDHAISSVISDPYVSNWLIERFIDGKIDRGFMDIIAAKTLFLHAMTENFDLKSAYGPSRRLFVYFCSMLREGGEGITRQEDKFVTLYERIGLETVKSTFAILTRSTNGLPIPSLTDIACYMTLEQKKEFLLNVLFTNSQYYEVVSKRLSRVTHDAIIGPKLAIIILLINYTSTQPDVLACPEAILALLVSTVYYFFQEKIDGVKQRTKFPFNDGHAQRWPRNHFGDHFKNSPPESLLDMRSLCEGPIEMNDHIGAEEKSDRGHYLSQLQAVILFYKRINDLLGESDQMNGSFVRPLPDVAPDEFMNGILIYNLCAILLDQGPNAFDWIQNFAFQRNPSFFLPILSDLCKLLSDKTAQLFSPLSLSPLLISSPRR